MHLSVRSNCHPWHDQISPQQLQDRNHDCQYHILVGFPLHEFALPANQLHVWIYHIRRLATQKKIQKQSSIQIVLKCLFCPFGWDHCYHSIVHIFSHPRKTSSPPPIPSNFAHLRTSPSTTPWPWPSFVLRSYRTPCRAWPRCAPWLSTERRWMVASVYDMGIPRK